MRDWMAMLASHLNSGVHTTATEAEEGDIRCAAEAAGLSYTLIDLRGVDGKPGFLHAIAAAMHFPEYFGGNWDALHDCLTDLSWQPARGYVLSLAGFQAFGEAATADAAIARSILQAAADFWKGNGVPFFAFFAAEESPDAPAAEAVNGGGQ